MRKDSPRVYDYLGHMLEACERIARYTSDVTEAEFQGSELIQDGVIRNIEILGEAARNIARHAPDFAAQHPEVPWEPVYLMRNRLSHGYFSVDLGVVWRTVQRDLPALKVEIARLRDEVGGTAEGRGSKATDE